MLFIKRTDIYSRSCYVTMVLPECMFVYHIYAWCPERSEEGVNVPSAEDTDSGSHGVGPGSSVRAASALTNCSVSPIPPSHFFPLTIPIPTLRDITDIFSNCLGLISLKLVQFNVWISAFSIPIGETSNTCSPQPTTGGWWSVIRSHSSDVLILHGVLPLTCGTAERLENSPPTQSML